MRKNDQKAIFAERERRIFQRSATVVQNDTMEHGVTALITYSPNDNSPDLAREFLPNQLPNIYPSSPW